MRYTVFETVVRQVSTNNITDEKTIQEVIQSLHAQELKCSLLLKNGSKFNKIKITGVGETGFAYLVVSSQSTLKKTSMFSDIESLEVHNITSELVNLNMHDDNRWSLLDSVDLNSK